MDERLQQAIAAIKAHDNQTAQQLLAQYLKTNPTHPQGWFLLSQVVADQKQQVAFLHKTLVLDPDHRQARQKLTAMGEAIPAKPATETPTLISPALPVSQDEGDWGAQVEATTIPPWMAGQKTYQAETLMQTQVGTQADEPEELAQPAAELPSWLAEEPVGEWAARKEEPVEEPVAAATPGPTPAPVAKPTPAKPARKEAEPLPWYFWLLVLCAVLVFIAIVVQFFSLLLS